MPKFKSSWREHANGIIVRVINENSDADEKELRKKIREAYPYGERAMHPYKIWCSEVARCLHSLRGIGTGGKKQKIIKEQGNLF